MIAQPFRIDIDEAVLLDLKERLGRTRWPDQIPGTGWDYGTDLSYLEELVAYWLNEYDWRKHEAALNVWPQFKTQIEGIDVHFVHIKGKGPASLPLVMTHGWPGSFFEMYKVIGPLTDPAAYGRDARDSFDLVVPSIPGFGFSGPTHERGVSPRRVAEVLHRLMTEELGYSRYGTQGGDFGSGISRQMALLFPNRVVGAHLNMVGGGPNESPANEQEREIEERRQWWVRDETGYSAIQRTKPQSLGYGLNDSPAGLAAWIVEKWRTWSDCDGDIERRFTKDELLTNVMIFWVTGTITSSMRFYYESAHAPAPTGKGPTPIGVAMFPKDMIRATRAQAERLHNITHWTEMPRGGHFAAMEEPELLVEDVRAFFRGLRTN
jgi:pimeloyl-ACP methyl ester carboxylesterase